MSGTVLSVGFAGPHVSVQDGGRPGLMRYGVPGSGAMDRRSFAAANIALGNPAGAPGIEISLGGLALECLSGTVSFAVAGGGFIVEHAGTRRSSWTVATLRAGERLTVRPGPWGSWCYLAFAGLLRSPRWLGSASTHAISGFGGGRLATGARLVIADAARREEREGSIPCPVAARPRRELRVTMGPQQRFFSAEAISAFLSGTWRMTDAWDRMGVRLAGPSIAPHAALDMPSEPIVRGSVQIAGDGVATVLLADHQTTGGYPKIATVLDCDLDSFVQLRPRDAVAFRPVSPEQAISLSRTAAIGAATYFRALSNTRQKPRAAARGG
ncbi:biotin-dependent carboxyltransferase family protein [Paracoccus sp. P2]|uniref:Allophanate hydrolase n=1 Tax=Paracoccus pantotrophus TaxID=82367 RepID=A0A1I5H0K5_PARPN|nr:biotin-dependent carboxyltransferase family protein [Paracoccus pantotrophus]MDF3854482.1 biotin-dependent carboxyltransferase family protein [Paracoccus pantotrophus]QFG38375.1 biotin-dependent carboxyltransferase [Paracoccus pantotrophus]QLH15928.1 biotin-dependent carboxyltransferase [Paracoccus pantotrophus]RDD98860.1 allophanate hydrolase [Paracoccus pantotrophus]RKS51105.1 allophanate hydrolase [Paracoccus pantotrophus]